MPAAALVFFGKVVQLMIRSPAKGQRRPSAAGQLSVLPAAGTNWRAKAESRQLKPGCGEDCRIFSIATGLKAGWPGVGPLRVHVAAAMARFANRRESNDGADEHQSGIAKDNPRRIQRR